MDSVGTEVLTLAVKSQQTLQWIMSPPSSGLKSRTSKSCLVYCSILKMDMICFSRASVDFQRTTWHYIPRDRTLLINCLYIYFKHVPVHLKDLEYLNKCTSSEWGNFPVQFLLITSYKACMRQHVHSFFYT
jgi:hypothetical protein